jgi:hypothetical protein
MNFIHGISLDEVTPMAIHLYNNGDKSSVQIFAGARVWAKVRE